MNSLLKNLSVGATLLWKKYCYLEKIEKRLED